MWLYRLILVTDSIYRIAAIHRRTLLYRRFRRGRWGHWLPSIWRTLQRADAFIVAQGITAEKHVDSLSRTQRGWVYVGQLVLACTLVFLFWISWPQQATAPDEPSGLLLAAPAFDRASTAGVLPAGEQRVDQRPASSQPAADPDTMDASAQAIAGQQADRPSVRAVLLQVLANGQNDVVPSPDANMPIDLDPLAARQQSGVVRSVANVLPLLDELSIIQAQRNQLAARAATARAVAANLMSSANSSIEATGDVPLERTTDDASTASGGDVTAAVGEEAVPVEAVLDQLVQTIASSSTDAITEDAITEDAITEDVPAEDAAAASTDVLSSVAVSDPVPAPVISYPYALELGRNWVSFAPAPAAEADHYWLELPFPPGYNQIYSPNYQFGSTAGGRYRPHHGVDTSNPTGAPVLAMAEGEVIHAGPDNPTLLGPYHNFYGNSVVIRLHRVLATPSGEKEVYLLYGHLNEVFATAGQQISVGEPVGAVGMTGIAIGPHLHVEVRVGQNSYFNTVNPALWIRPVSGTGSVAVRVLNAEGRSWAGAKVSLLRYQGGGAVWSRTIETYRDTENLGGDPLWGENGALSNISAGSYYITTEINGEKIGQNIEIRAGETTFVELRTVQ